MKCVQGGTRKTPLHYAVEKSKADAVEYLLKKSARPHLPDKSMSIDCIFGICNVFIVMNDWLVNFIYSYIHFLNIE